MDALCCLATGRHLVVICDICHRMISCFIVCCLCCLSFLNASFFLNGFLDAAQLLFSGASYVIRIKWWQMHPEKNGSLWVVHHLRAVQGDISLPGTHVAPRGPGHAKEHWMAKVAPAFNFGWGKVDDILNHCFNPIPIGRPDKSAQGWHAWFDGGCPWLTMEA